MVKENNTMYNCKNGNDKNTICSAKKKKYRVKLGGYVKPKYNNI